MRPSFALFVLAFSLEVVIYVLNIPSFLIPGGETV